MNKRKCPICGSDLEQDIKQGYNDELIVSCNHCGKYAMSYEFYSDFIDRPCIRINLARIAAYLSNHKNSAVIPCICESANAASEKYNFVSFQRIECQKA